jgi:hypothetical protein
MKKIQFLAIVGGTAAALAAGAPAHALEIAANGQYEWACGGAGAEERQHIKLLETEATSSLMFVTEGRGGYLADVEFVIRDQAGNAVLSGKSDGPVCLLRMPAGRYKVEASAEGARRVATIQNPASPGKPTRMTLTFPRDRAEVIAPSAEEKAQARQVARE